MALRRIFVERFADGLASIGGAKAKHYARAVRLRLGERVELSDGERVFVATVSEVAAGRVGFALEDELADAAGALALVAVIAVVKFARMDAAVEKAVELGVKAVIPLKAERSDPHLVAACGARRARWERISEEAAEQSRRIGPPSIEPVSQLRTVLDAYSNVWIADPTGGHSGGLDRTARGGGDLAVCVGPEGGWTDEELRAADGAGAFRLGLGEHVLRAETAVTAALAVASHWLRG